MLDAALQTMTLYPVSSVYCSQCRVHIYKYMSLHSEEVLHYHRPVWSKLIIDIGTNTNASAYVQVHLLCKILARFQNPILIRRILYAWAMT